ncbi:protein of unknown function DUF2431 [Macleaya cordata]|uniref:25S rRNA (uridine-N(3))-methyltransferase BMT5-like domain-containing protein n=1 Tax=Macleaya cordata TaxID=56857 RepID=A0A200QCJ6_MACCD|nr:protein of unknown function DUF2431 [Macleaya cordata]
MNADVVIAKYKYGKANLEVLKKLGCKIVHEVDVHAMTQHPYLNTTKYDRIVYNFPHAGFQYSESNLSQIK